ncbi:RelA/SpoT domain-containing protein [Bradyrhizobium sp. LjRoot220]|uniref:GTP pyrophosphokinase n=1 Tax=Bradyrhizobium sp. LjRoot220 TaxID=3342284 RepID=UPI003ED00D83
MNLKQYVDKGQSAYDAFAKTIRGIMEIVLETEPSIVKPQQIQTRAKSTSSLARKLSERGLTKSRSIETKLKDLAGVRLIFYTNTDVDSFLNSRLLQDNFDIDYDESKIHEPAGISSEANGQYRAIHYVVTLKPERIALPEYARFRGLRCEIQIQTILNHAWAETAHDITYHRQETAGFGTKQLEQIQKQTTAIMEKYLLPAGYEFQKVQHDYRRLMEGKALFDRDTVAALDSCDNNNDRYDLLKKISEDVIPQYDDINAVAQDLRNAAVRALSAARQTETREIETTFGAYEGHSEKDVAEAAIDIIRHLRYTDIAASFDALCSLYPDAKSDDERKLILDTVEELAKHNVTVWQQAGSYVQDTLVGIIAGQSAAVREQNRTVILCVCRNVLTSEMRGVSATTYDTVSFQTGAVTATRGLDETRAEAIRIVCEFYDRATTEAQKLESYEALKPAMALPNMGNYGDSLWLLVLRDTKAIVDFMTNQKAAQPYGLLQDLERQCLTSRMQHIGVQKNPPKDAAIATSYKELESTITGFRKLLGADDTYQKYKTFVGYHPVFDESFKGGHLGYKRTQAIRDHRVDTYVAELGEGNESPWLELVKSLSKERDSTYVLMQFLTKVGGQKPQIALRWLADTTLSEQRLIFALLDGLLSSSDQTEARALLDRWIDQGQNLLAASYALRSDKHFDPKLFTRLGAKIIAANEPVALNELVCCFLTKGSALLPVEAIDSLLLPAIERLAVANNCWWIVQSGFDENAEKLLSSLNEEQANAILRNLVRAPQVDVHFEMVLLPIAKTFATSVLQFFKQRIDHGPQSSEGDRYEAVPFSLSELPKAYVGKEGTAATVIRAWYKVDDYLFQYHGGRLLALLSPTFSPDLASALQLLAYRDDAGIDFALAVLNNFEGEPPTHDTFKVIVNLLPKEDKRLGEIEQALMSTGVVHGEFGFVEAYRAKKTEIQPWLSDTRPRVKGFAEQYVRSLERAIGAGHRRAEQDLEMRKHRFESGSEA